MYVYLKYVHKISPLYRIYIMKLVKIDIYNFIIMKLNKVLKFISNNSKYSPKIIFDSLIYILQSNVSWNSKIILDNKIIPTNSIYKHFIFLTKINFLKKFCVPLITHFFLILCIIIHIILLILHLLPINAAQLNIPI